MILVERCYLEVGISGSCSVFDGDPGLRGHLVANFEGDKAYEHACIFARALAGKPEPLRVIDEEARRGIAELRKRFAGLCTDLYAAASS